MAMKPWEMKIILFGLGYLLSLLSTGFGKSFLIETKHDQRPETNPTKAKVINLDNWNEGLFEGDMKLSRQQEQMIEAADITDDVIEGGSDTKLRPPDNGLIDPTKRWPNGEVRFQIASNVKEKDKQLIRDTLKNLERKFGSCIKFIEANDKNRVLVINNGGGCWSEVGYIKREIQELSLQESGCMYSGVIEHEFLHTLGLFHHQSRSDRDKYVEIIWDNIPRRQHHNFRKYSDKLINHHGLPYDYASIMHYGGTDFARRRGQMTIRTLDSSKQNVIGQKEEVSPGDIQLVKEMYSSCSSHGGNERLWSGEDWDWDWD